MRQVLPVTTAIISDPSIDSGRPIISGTYIKVSDIVIHYAVWEQAPEEIATQLGLSLVQIHTALAFYYEHQDAIDSEIDGRDQIADPLNDIVL